MSKVRQTIGTDGLPLPILPPVRDARVWARLVRVMFYTPGFMALLLIKAGEPAAFGITVELLMLSTATAIIGGLYIGTQSSKEGADSSSKVGSWSGALVLELLCVVPFLCALPTLFHELAHSRLLHDAVAPTAVDISLGASEMLPAVAILPFLLYQLRGFRHNPLHRAEAGELGDQHRHPYSNHGNLRRQPHGFIWPGKKIRLAPGCSDGDYGCLRRS